MKPLVSVIIPLYNRAPLILETLGSVLEQTYRPIELIVIDDESTDNSIEIVKHFKSENNSDQFRIKISKQKNSGAPTARNRGIFSSKGKYLQFLDSDDILKPSKLQEEIKVLETNRNLDIVYSKAQFFTGNGNLQEEFWGIPLTSSSADYFNNSWQTMCPLYRRSAVETIGLWNPDLPINQDWEYCIRTITSDLNIQFIPEVHSLFRVHQFGNIGSGLDPEKVKGKELATTSVYHLLKEKGLLDNLLKKQFFKRYLFCLSYYAIYRASEERQRLLSFLEEESFPLKRVLKIYRIPFIGKITLYLHSGFPIFKRNN